MRKVVILANNSGGGHQQTARILAQTLRDHGWTPQVVSIYRDIFPNHFQFFGWEGEAFYNNFILMREMPSFIYRAFFITAYYGIIQPRHRVLAQQLAAFWQQSQPDLVISVIPLLNQVIAESLTLIEPPPPFAIIQTDLFEFHEPFWLTPSGTWFVADDKTYTIVGTEEAHQQVRSQFVADPARVFKLTGQIIDPCFNKKPTFNRGVARQKLGLDPAKLVGLLLYGSVAPHRLLSIAQALNRLGDQVQFIFICGKNEKLRQRLEALPTRYAKVVVGYTSELPHIMHLSDFLIGKPGPGTIMEGSAAGLPLLLDGQRVIIHESQNIAWVERQGLGVSFRDMGQLCAHIQTLISSPEDHPLKTQGQIYENRAIEEFPGVIEAIVAHFRVG